ncbi:uncharacterized protein LAESUDRAFT_761672 [Laetiporus sulphureus 93-53]|uniref:Uncharacterized protein n=1 Tax=Laetiporus sulphureus 93-53 TaxID=1314785 RepID=A0A165CZN3_9APHY|nr:uncharacterized protein LAESUDRAFT_761672 [Laetiporus sulphureus 93-53]KZT03832.1 hypothetical protein LAESUDRAFT_761672 [Laetiporus sulphureus 93-53]
MAFAIRVVIAGKGARNSVKYTEEIAGAATDRSRPAKRARKEKTRTSAKVAFKDSGESLLEDVENEVPKSKRVSQKPMAGKPVSTDFAPKTVIAWKIGPHVSDAGEVENTIVNAAAVGVRQVTAKLGFIAPDQRVYRLAKSLMKAFGYSACHILPHQNYFINLGNPDKKKREKS